MLCWLSSPVAQATDLGLKCFVSINVSLSGFEAAHRIAAAVLCLLPGSAEQIGQPGLKASVSLGWLRCIPLQLEMAAVAFEMSVAQMFKLHLSYMKVSVAVAAGADEHILLPCCECC